MQKLIEGLHTFRADIFLKKRELYQTLALGQRPETLFITCSDSRVEPNQLTQTGPGELFLLRNAGNLVPRHGVHHGGETATIEYAIEVLGVSDVIVCGHSDCGAMRALLDPRSAEGLPEVQLWLRHAERTREIVEENYRHLEGRRRLMATIQENVLVQLEQLRTHPAVARAQAAGRLRLHGWVYKIEAGEVFAYDPVTGQFPSLIAPAMTGTDS